MAKKIMSVGDAKREIVEGLVDVYINGKNPDDSRRRIVLGVDDLRGELGSKCLFPSDHGRGICGAPAIEGHSIPLNVLQKVEQSPNEGWVIPTNTKARRALFLLWGSRKPNIEKKPATHALTGHFSCDSHDDEFKKVDKIESDFDFHDSERQFLFAYRAVLYTSAEINGVLRAFSVVKGVMDGRNKLGSAMRGALGDERQRQVRLELK